MIDSLRTTYNLCIFQMFILFPMLMLLVSVYGSPHNPKILKPNRSGSSSSSSLVETTRPVGNLRTGRTCLDMECGQGGQCLMIYPPCRSEPCPVPNPTCVSNEPCNALECRKGQHCVMQNVVMPCLVPPCPVAIRPTCTLS